MLKDMDCQRVPVEGNGHGDGGTYSHLASGADGIMYWHWHSIHNSFETYWRGLLSHDFESNPTYEEAGRF